MEGVRLAIDLPNAQPSLSQAEAEAEAAQIAAENGQNNFPAFT